MAAVLNVTDVEPDIPARIQFIWFPGTGSEHATCVTISFQNPCSQRRRYGALKLVVGVVRRQLQ